MAPRLLFAARREKDNAMRCLFRAANDISEQIPPARANAQNEKLIPRAIHDLAVVRSPRCVGRTGKGAG